MSPALPFRVALTFDAEHPDRPHRPGVTAGLLDVLAERGVPSTWFLQGRWVEAEPVLARRVADEGHLVGNHSFYHARMPLLTDDGLATDVREAEAVIRDATGVDPRPWFRCPFSAGDDDPRVLAALGGPRLPRRRRRRRARGLGAVADRRGDGRRRPGPRRPRSATARSCCSTPGRRGRSTRCRRSSTASARPARRSSASTSSSGSPGEGHLCSPSTAATRRPTSRCARPTVRCWPPFAGRRPRTRRSGWMPASTGWPGSWPTCGGSRPARRSPSRRLLPRRVRPPERRGAAHGPSYAARGFATEILLFNDTFAALRAGTPDGWGVAVICGSGMNAVGRAPRRARRAVHRPRRHRRRSRRWVGARDVGSRGGGPGGRRTRAGDVAVGAGSRALRARRAGRRDGGVLRGPDRRAAGWGSWRRWSPRPRGTATRCDRARRRHRGRDRGLRDGVDPAAGPARRKPCPVTLAGGLARGAADLLVPARDGAGTRARAARRGLGAPRAAGARRRALRAGPARRPAIMPRRIGCGRRSRRGTRPSTRPGTFLTDPQLVTVSH